MVLCVCVSWAPYSWCKLFFGLPMQSLLKTDNVVATLLITAIYFFFSPPISIQPQVNAQKLPVFLCVTADMIRHTLLSSIDKDNSTENGSGTEIEKQILDDSSASDISLGSPTAEDSADQMDSQSGAESTTDNTILPSQSTFTFVNTARYRNRGKKTVEQRKNWKITEFEDPVIQYIKSPTRPKKQDTPHVSPKKQDTPHVSPKNQDIPHVSPKKVTSSDSRQSLKNVISCDSSEIPETVISSRIRDLSVGLVLETLRQKTISVRPKIKSLETFVTEKPSSARESLRPAIITAKQLEDGIMTTNCINPNLFHIQRHCDKEKLEALSVEVNEAGVSSVQPNSVNEGSIYLGCFSADDCWYRIVVVDLDCEINMAIVKYIDYGNSEKLHFSRIHECPPHLSLASIPPFGIECSLWDVAPKGSETWSELAVSFFHELIMGHSNEMQLFIYSVNTSHDSETSFMPKCQVDICCKIILPECSYLPVSARECLIFHDYAEPVGNEEENISSFCYRDGVRWMKSYTEPYIEFTLKPVSVRLAHVESPFSFFLQIEPYRKQLEGLLGKMQAHYNNKVRNAKDWNLLLPKVGMPCVARCISDNKWHRAWINSVTNKNSINITYIDLGLKKNVSYKLLRKISDEFMKIAHQAVPCKLAHVATPVGEKWDDSATAKFKDMLNDSSNNLKAVFYKLEDDIYEVSLMAYEGDTEVDIALTLIDEGYADAPERSLSNRLQFCGLHSLSLEAFDNGLSSSRTIRKVNPARRCTEIMTKSEHVLSASSLNMNTSKGVTHFVKFLSIISPSFIDVCFTSSLPKLQSLEEDLDKEMLHTKYVAGYKPSNGEVCCVKLEQSPQHVRVKVLCIYDTYIKVYHIDRGGIQDYQCSRFQPVPISFKERPPLAITVSLHNIIPPCGQKQWANTTFDFMKEALKLQTNLYMVRRGRSYRDKDVWNLKVLPVELGWVHEATEPFEVNQVTFFSFSDLLTEKGLALPRRISSEKGMQNYSKYTSLDSVTVSHFTVAETLEMSVTKINSCSSKSVQDEKTPVENSATQVTCSQNQSKGKRTPQKDSASDFTEHRERIVTPEVTYYPLQRNSPLMSDSSTSCFVEGAGSLRAEKFFTPPEEIPEENSSSETDSQLSLKEVLFPSPPTLLEQKFKAIVTYVDMKGQFYLHPLSHKATLEHMKDSHNLQFSESEVTDPDMCWGKGDYVVTKYHLDNCWYRAKILKVSTPDIRVLFIDYGNEEVVNINEVRGQNLFPKTPVQCYRCVLHGVAPACAKGWTLNVLDFIHKYSVTSLFEVTLMAPHRRGATAKVELRRLNDNPSCETLSEFLVDTMMLCKRVLDEELCDEEESEAETCNMMEESDSEDEKMNYLSRLPLPTDSNELIVVKVVALKTPAEVYIVPLPKMTEALKVTNFVTKLQKLHDEYTVFQENLSDIVSKLPMVPDPKVGAICLAFITDMEEWCRSRVLRVDKSEVDIICIDTAIEERVSREWLRELPVECKSIPGLSVLVQLKGVTYPEGQDTWSVQAEEAMRECLVGSSQMIFAAVEEQEEEVPQVQLYFKDEDGIKYLCYDSILEEQLMKWQN